MINKLKEDIEGATGYNVFINYAGSDTNTNNDATIFVDVESINVVSGFIKGEMSFTGVEPNEFITKTMLIPNMILDSDVKVHISRVGGSMLFYQGFTYSFDKNGISKYVNKIKEIK